MDKNKVIQNAQKFVQKGQLDKAIREYEKVVKADPRDVRTRLKIGDLQAKKGDNRAAAETYLQVAESYGQQGFFLKAVAVFKNILKLDPDRVDVNMKLAELYHQLGLMSDAMAQYQAVAAYYERTGDTRASFDTLRRMLDLDPDNVASRIKLAEMYSKEGMTVEAIQEFRNAAEYLKERNRIDDYIKVVERLIFHEPNNLDATRELANIYLTKGETKRALAKLQVCFKSNPRDVETLHLLARAFEDLGQPNKSISVYKELAKIYGDEGQVDEQRAAWKKVLDLSPQDPEALAATGQAPPPAASVPADGPSAAPPAGPPPGAAAPPTGRPPGAAAAAPAPTGPEAVAKLLTETDVYVKYGLRDKAIEHLKKVFAVDPQNIPGHEKAKDLFVEAGNLEAAADELAILIGLLKGQDPERARALLGELMEANPRHPDAAGFVAELGQPEVRQVSFLDEPEVLPSADDSDMIIAEDDGEVLVADGTDFDEVSDAFTLDVDPAVDAAVEPVAAADGFADGEFAVVDDDFSGPQEGGFELDDDLDAGPAPKYDLDEGDSSAFIIDAGLDDDPFAEPAVTADAFDDDDSSNPTEMLPLDDVPELLDARGDADPEDGLDDFGAGHEPGFEDDLETGFDDDLETGFDDDLEPGLGAGLDAGAAEDLDDGFGDDDLASTGEGLGEVEVGYDDPEFTAPGDAIPAEVAEAADLEPVIEPSGTELVASKTDEEIADELEEAEFFVQQGLPDEAREVLKGILAVVPHHPEARSLLQQLEAGGEVEPAAPDLDADVSAEEPAAASDEGLAFDDFDLAGELADELAGLEDDFGASNPLQDLQVSADDVFAEFKKGVAETVGAEDADTHYDLGIAYREMGLTADAIHEFELAAKQPSRRLDALTMVATCQRELGQLDAAIETFKSALQGDGVDQEAQKALYFELGDVHEAQGDNDEAVYYFRKVASLDGDYRSAQSRLEALGDDGDALSGSGPNGMPGDESDGRGNAPAKSRSSKVGYV